MVTVSDADIVKRLVEVLNAADLATTTTSTVRRQLEQDFRIDLSDKKPFIRKHVDIYLEQKQQEQQQQQQLVQAASLAVNKKAERKEEEKDQPQQEEEEEQGRVKEEDNEGGEGEEEEGEEEEDADQPELDSKRLQAKINRAKKESLQKDSKKRGNGGGLNKLCELSPELQALIGVKEMPRTQVVKALWAYIRENNLQDPGNKRKIICDNALRAVFGIESTDMFKMNKLLSKHIWPLKNQDEGDPKPKRSKPELKESMEKGGKVKGSGFLAPLSLSEALMNFLGTGESELSRTEVVKRMWQYIKQNQLQDPADRRRILCDNKLQELLGCEKFNGFGMTKHLAPHFIKS